MAGYGDDDRARALALLETHGGNVSRVARETGIPRRTIGGWRDQAIAAGQAVTTRTGTDWQAVRQQAGHLFLANAQRAAEIVQGELARLRGGDLSLADVQRLAVISGIQADKAYALLVGKQGTEFNVHMDQRQVTLQQQLARLSDDDVRAMAALARQVIAEQAAESAPA